MMVLNWGGVGNVTYLGPKGEVVAFDTGPANALLDDFVARRRGLSRDEGGALAASGTPDARVVDRLMRDPYFERPIPKSLDRNHFHRAALAVESLGDADGAATLAAFTVEATAAALRHVSNPPTRWLVCGGGRRNLTLMRMLATRLGAPVYPIESIAWDGDVIEAQCFAYLALRSRRRLPISLPTTTGAPTPLTGGAFWPSQKKGGPGEAGPPVEREGGFAVDSDARGARR
jgi:anhydro-N-acetylmuramic acid kinase